MLDAASTASSLLANKTKQPQKKQAKSFAPSNIALIKYWGKRDTFLNLPHTNSLSVSLGSMGATTHINTTDHALAVTLNREAMPTQSALVVGIQHYLAMLGIEQKLHIDIDMNIPMAAGLASSACGFASLIQTLNELYQWHLSNNALSILARLGSGSACRSLWHGFVEWQKGLEPDGSDSHGIPLDLRWNDLRIGLIIVSTDKKSIGSRLAMQRTIDESILYQSWQQQVAHDLPLLKQALQHKNFTQLGEIAENNACAMHATMLAARPAIIYSNAQTMDAIHSIKALRDSGTDCYFTQDAGPNIKLIFLEESEKILLQHFPSMTVVKPFA